MNRARELERAIRAKCLDCCGGIRAEVRGCRIEDCPLWPYRSAPETAAGAGSAGAVRERGAGGLAGQMDIRELEAVI